MGRAALRASFDKAPSGCRDIEVQHVFANAQFGVERYGGFILEIGLHEDDVAAAPPADLPEALDERRRAPLAPVRLSHRPIWDVVLALHLLAILYLLHRQPALQRHTITAAHAPPHTPHPQ